MRNCLLRPVIFFICLITFTSTLFAFEENEGSGTIKGTVTTADGKPAALVTVVLKSTRKKTLSGDDGSFTLRNIQPGNYTLEVWLVGYAPVTREVVVEAGKTTTEDAQVSVSSEELQEVTVKSSSGYKTNTPSSTLKLTTPLLETPQNIQVVTGKTLRDQQVISMSDGVIRNVSGAVRLEHWGDMYANITARGSQLQAFRNGFNVVNSYWGPLTEDMSFVDHIEFVKGPAGFMLSNGDPAGLYNVVTKKPTGQTRGSAEITMGSFDLYRAAVDLDGKLSKDGRLLYRLNVMGQNKNSFRANEFNNRYSIAPVISFQVDEKTKLTLEYTLQHANMSDVGSYYVFSPKGYATLPRDFTMMPAGMEPTNIDDHSVFLNMQHQIDNNWKLTAQLAYFKYKQVGSDMWPAAVNEDGTIQRAVSGWDAKSKMTMGQVFLNGDANTGTVHHRILAGLDVGTKDYIADWGQYHVFDSAGAEFNPLAPSYGVPSNGYPSFDHDMSTLPQRALAVGGLMSQRYTGVYIQDELGFFDNLFRLTLAGRYTQVSMAEWGDPAKKANRFTPRIGLSISLDKFTAVYGLYDQAFIPQSGKLAGSGSVKPITGNNLEFGLKKDWANGKWNTTVAVYRILKNNELTADPNSPPASGLSIVLGQKRSQGIEFDMRGKITNNLSLVANYALTDSKVTKVAAGITDMKVGDVVPGYAKNTANTWLSYQAINGTLKGFGASAGFTWLLGRRTDSWSDTDVRLPDYFKLDGGVFWQGNKIRVTANVFNLLDKYLYSGSYYSYLKAFYWQAEAPRNVRLSIAYNF